ncbi:PREDICTED: coiled-coil domain-containing protein 124 [Rhinopithecus bieti]|uniref:coiled-coil domain-containing protein 124 n=1 Tax=Rhinopithecus bieti TaxID=61621 RepID=UPI00083C6112|nr:PREDICTED: coiled-coil domain-containing protein 124 [Rhinopithecus bieti]
MPKKFQGENTKSAAARARRAEAKAAADAKKQKELEDAYWKDDDKHVMRKEQRKVRVPQVPAACVPCGRGQWSLCQFSISSPWNCASLLISLCLCHPPTRPAEKAKSHLEVPLEENVNRRVLEEGSMEARTIEDAIAVLSVAEEAADRHPERRMRAAFTAFEEAQLPRLKQENPNMRLSQLKQLLKKEWLRSPDNPMNQRAVPFNAPK